MIFTSLYYQFSLQKCQGSDSPGAQFAAPTFSWGPICRGPICRGPICRLGAQSARAQFAAKKIPGPNSPHPKSAGAQFAAKNRSGPNLPRALLSIKLFQIKSGKVFFGPELPSFIQGKLDAFEGDDHIHNIVFLGHVLTVFIS